MPLSNPFSEVMKLLRMHKKDFTVHFDNFDAIKADLKPFLQDFFGAWNKQVAPILEELNKDKK